MGHVRPADLLDIQPATQDRSLLDAVAVVSRHRHTRRDELSDKIDLGFAAQRWQNIVTRRRSTCAIAILQWMAAGKSCTGGRSVHSMQY
jgi:hypothetical protein